MTITNRIFQFLYFFEAAVSTLFAVGCITMSPTVIDPRASPSECCFEAIIFLFVAFVLVILALLQPNGEV